MQKPYSNIKRERIGDVEFNPKQSLSLYGKTFLKMQEIYWHLTFVGIYYKYSKGTLANENIGGMKLWELQEII